MWKYFLARFKWYRKLTKGTWYQIWFRVDMNQITTWSRTDATLGEKRLAVETY